MKTRLLPAVVFSLALAASVCAQDASSAPPAAENSGKPAGAGGNGQRAGRNGFGGSVGRAIASGSGIMGVVTEVAADHYTVKIDTGEIYTVNFSVNSRIFKMPAGAPGGGMGTGSGRGAGSGMGQGGRMGQPGNPPVAIKATDIKVGDAVAAMGDLNVPAKSVGAVSIIQLDPERARQMREVQANFGKTWIMGKVTAIDGVKVTLMSSIDNASHAFAADENTTFRKRRVPITLADIQPGDMVRAEGALKDGAFTATAVNVMGMPQGGTPTVPRTAPPQ